RCIDCFGRFSFCQECMLERHQSLPCHRLEKWNGACFTQTTLLAEGYLLHLGHGRDCSAFTFDLLDYFWVDMIECKNVNQSFIRKLGHITNPDFPEDSLVRSHTLCIFTALTPSQQLYRQLLYCSRSYRYLVTRVTFGYGHNLAKEPGVGSLALFCPACPQPGFNLPDNWED
ncbi:hypothetical protein FIBSPDRAFT_688396, partial [Athelia psychrophila]